MKIYDVTRTISEALPTYPDDPPTRIRRVSDVREGDPFTLSEICMSSHAGTHVDAPLHLFPEGKSVDEIPLDVLIGHAVVVEAADGEVTAEVFDSFNIPPNTSRLLLKTDDAFLSEDAAQWIVDRGIKLVGIDSMSVDATGSHVLTAHRILLKAGVVIIEGLDLSAVTPATYHMICLPLKLKGCDGAPARVVLTENV